MEWRKKNRMNLQTPPNTIEFRAGVSFINPRVWNVWTENVFRYGTKTMYTCTVHTFQHTHKKKQRKEKKYLRTTITRELKKNYLMISLHHRVWMSLSMSFHSFFFKLLPFSKNSMNIFVDFYKSIWIHSVFFLLLFSFRNYRSRSIFKCDNIFHRKIPNHWTCIF